jgi:hypothetical protein
MVFDSFSALILFGACIAAWTLTAQARASVRIQLRFAALLCAALAVADGLSLVLPALRNLAPAVAMMTMSLGTTALALGLGALVSRALPAVVASLALALALGAGLAASLSGLPVYAFGCQLVAVLLTVIAAFGGPVFGKRIAVMVLLAVLAFACGGLCLMGNAPNGYGVSPALLFFAGGLIAAARASQPLPSSEALVQAQRKARRFAGVAARG